MNISYNWLCELTGLTAAPQELARRLTMAGLAVDAVHEAGDDFVLDVDLTSNRPDCLSHVGVAREAAALLGAGLREPDAEALPAEGRAEALTHVEIEDAGLCPRYAARVVRGVTVGPSPEWLARRLQAIGQRPINNVADITNFVMHELGQPLHAFDLSTLAERRIVVRRARAGEKIRTLDGAERALDGEMLVIADATRAVAVAGVMGGEETEISDATTEVLIESAYFDPASVRRTSKALGLQTEASYRFERGTDYEGVRRAQDRCVALICQLAGGTATEDALDVYPKKLSRPTVHLRPRRVKELTGLSVPAEECVRILTALGFEPSGFDGSQPACATDTREDSGVTFDVPSWRTDVSLEEDLVEEVARHFGYEKIEEALPAGGVAGEYLPGDERRRAARATLNACGLSEAVNFSFIDVSHDGRFELLPELPAADAGAEAFVALSNPIIEGSTRMRPTLLPGLLDAARHNFNHGTRNVRLFELGRVFAAADNDDGQDKDSARPLEVESFALLLTGAGVEEGRAAGRELDFYDLKGAFEAAAEALGASELTFEAAGVRHLREGQSARVSAGGRVLGTLGRLSEELAAEYKFRQPVYVAEVNLGALLEAQAAPARYAPLPRFPSVVRDISLLASRDSSFGEMRRAVFGLGVAECRAVRLVDVYEGANLPEGKRSVTLRVEYRSDERTLRDEEVDAMHARVVAALESGFGAQLRA